jgi:KUP system potassium uptake protein
LYWLIQVAKYPEVFKALNPYYAYNLLSVHPTVFVLGFVTTGAEALYSDMGHCGRKIFGSVGFSKITLVLNYFGQAAYLIHHEGETLTTLGGPNGNPFYLIMADWFQPISYNCCSSRYSLRHLLAHLH